MCPGSPRCLFTGTRYCNAQRNKASEPSKRRSLSFACTSFSPTQASSLGPSAPSPLAVSKAAHVLAPHYPLHTLCTPSAHCSRAPSPTALTRARPPTDTNQQMMTALAPTTIPATPAKGLARKLLCAIRVGSPRHSMLTFVLLLLQLRHNAQIRAFSSMTVTAMTAAPEMCTTSAAWAPTAEIVAIVSRARRRRRRRRRRHYPTGSRAPRHQRRNSRSRGSSHYFSASSAASALSFLPRTKAKKKEGIDLRHSSVWVACSGCPS